MPMPPGTDVDQLYADQERIVHPFPSSDEGSVVARPPAEGLPASALPPPLEVGGAAGELPSAPPTLSPEAMMPDSLSPLPGAIDVAGSVLPPALLSASPTPSTGGAAVGAMMIQGPASPQGEVPVLDETMISELMERLR